MTIQKSRGYSWENEVCKTFNRNFRYNAVRLGAPGQPDVMAIDFRGIMTLIECKSTVSDNITIPAKQLIMLYEWGGMFDAKFVIAAKFGQAKEKNVVVKEVKKYYFLVEWWKDQKKSIGINRDGNASNMHYRPFVFPVKSEF